MIEELLPAAAVSAEVFDDEAPVALFAVEKAAVARAVERRRREFASGRGCAHRALERLGLEPGPVPAGERGEPLWPEGVVGSISHCRGYRGSAVAHTEDLVALGIDAEPHAPLPAGLLKDVARPEELGPLAELARTHPAIHWDRLTFSAKEAIYKAWNPLTGRWLGLEDAALTIDPATGTFSARLFVAGPGPTSLDGRWLVADDLVLTAVALGA